MVRPGGSVAFVESAQAKVSRAPFFAVCVAVIVGWLVSYPLFSDPKSWQVVLHTITSVITPTGA
jgi:low affinity Fe/Cu permease